MQKNIKVLMIVIVLVITACIEYILISIHSLDDKIDVTKQEVMHVINSLPVVDQKKYDDEIFKLQQDMSTYGNKLEHINNTFTDWNKMWDQLFGYEQENYIKK